uniref:Intraflagellar transport protein 140 homolog n=1 Tax=Caenorhabditis japonica TaxID=281687 RepID=A0A8R1HJJ6_CAEJA
MAISQKFPEENSYPNYPPSAHRVLDNYPHPNVGVEWSHDGSILMTLHSPSSVHMYSYLSIGDDISTSNVMQVELNDEILHWAKRLSYEKYRSNQITTDEDSGVDEPPFGSKEELSDGREANKSSVPTGSEFLFGSKSGHIFGVDSERQRTVHKLDSEVLFIDYCEVISTIVAFTRDGFIFHLTKGSAEGRCAERVKVKLGGKSDDYRMQLNDGMLVMSYGAREVRIWDLVREENGTLALEANKGFVVDEETINVVTVNGKRGVITAATSRNNIAEWKRRRQDTHIETAWQLSPCTHLDSPISLIRWSPVLSTCAVITDDTLVLFGENNASVKMRGKVAAIQTSSNSFTLLNAATGVSQDLKLTIPSARGISLGEKQLVVWSDDTVVTYDVQTSLATIQCTSFSCVTTNVGIANQNLYCVEKDKIMARTLQGTLRQEISLPKSEGDPEMLEINKNWMAVATTNGFIRIYNLNSRDAQQEHNSKYVVENLKNFYKFHTIKINQTGNKVAVTYLEDVSTVAELLLVFDAETDSISSFSFDKGMTDTQEYEAQAELAHTSHGRPVTAAARKMAKEKSRFQMMNHRPGNVEWDENDQRYLVIECVHLEPESTDQRVLTTFVTSEHGIQLQDIQQKSSHCGKLVSVSVPNFYFVRKSGWDEDDSRGEKTIGKTLVAKCLREFLGNESCDEATTRAMMDFSFYLTIGSMDAAFKAIQFIQSDSVWEHMASMSIKTRRLDVAMVCLGHMKNVRGARAVRKAHQNGENDSMKCAALALELGMLEEAQIIYAQNERYDLVNKLHQKQNAWSQAFEIAETRDRIHLRNTHYNYAKFLEAKRDSSVIEAAITNYEKAGVHAFEVFRMLKDYPKQIEQYVRRKREDTLYSMWGAYLESVGELEGAISFYHSAKDFYCLVRVKCIQGKIEEASKLAEDSKDKAACYLIGRMYEGDGDVVKAVKFFTKARALSSAIRLAKEHDMKDRLANLCLMAGGAELVSAARYYEDMPGYAHKAVMLYHKAGMIGRALDLAFRTEQFSALDLITKDLDAGTDPKTLKRAAEFFESNQNYEKAVNFLCLAKDFAAAVQLCRSKNVRVTDVFAEKMTPTKEDIPNAQERKRILENVAELCLQQGAYSAAAKKFTQAGDKLSAMRALLKSGDVQKIRFFANTARNKEIYILAANFMQTTNWQDNPQTMKDIETFYTKSQSFEHLGNFYKAVAIIEAENLRMLDKAMQALEMAAVCIGEAEQRNMFTAGVEALKEDVKRYVVQLRKLQKVLDVMKTDAADGVRQLTTLAEESLEDDIVPCTRLFALLIDDYATKKNWKQAYRTIQALQKKVGGVDLETFLETATLDRVCDEMRVERVTKKKNDEEAESDGEEVDFSHSFKRQNNS